VPVSFRSFLSQRKEQVKGSLKLQEKQTHPIHFPIIKNPIHISIEMLRSGSRQPGENPEFTE
jgi:hypothetical protein